MQSKSSNTNEISNHQNTKSIWKSKEEKNSKESNTYETALFVQDSPSEWTESNDDKMFIAKDFLNHTRIRKMLLERMNNFEDDTCFYM